LVFGSVAVRIDIGRAVDQLVAARVVLDGAADLALVVHTHMVLTVSLTGRRIVTPRGDVVTKTVAVGIGHAAIAGTAAESILAVIAQALVVTEAVRLVTGVPVLIVPHAFV